MRAAIPLAFTKTLSLSTNSFSHIKQELAIFTVGEYDEQNLNKK